MWAQRTHSITSHPIWVTPAPHEPKGGGGAPSKPRRGRGQNWLRKGQNGPTGKLKSSGNHFCRRLLFACFRPSLVPVWSGGPPSSCAPGQLYLQLGVAQLRDLGARSTTKHHKKSPF